jgi:hypothetical protein
MVDDIVVDAEKVTGVVVQDEDEVFIDEDDDKL